MRFHPADHLPRFALSAHQRIDPARFRFGYLFQTSVSSLPFSNTAIASSYLPSFALTVSPKTKIRIDDRGSQFNRALQCGKALSYLRAR